MLGNPVNLVSKLVKYFGQKEHGPDLIAATLCRYVAFWKKIPTFAKEI